MLQSRNLLMHMAVMMAAAAAGGKAGGGAKEPVKSVAGTVQTAAESAAAAGGTAVGEVKNTAVSTDVMDMESDAGAGTEGADGDSYAIPFLVVLQPMSPVLTADPPLEGGKPGMFMNSVTNQLLGTSVIIIPCAFQRRFIRWAPRETGGGFKGEHTVAEAAEMRQNGTVKEVDGRLYFPLDDGSINEKKCDKLVDTRSHFCLVMENKEGAEIATPIVFALTSTNIKASKNLMSRIDGVKFKRSTGVGTFTPPSYSHMYVIESERKENDKGIWWLTNVTMGRRLPDDEQGQELYKLAKAFNKRVTEGKVIVAHDSVAGSVGSDSGGTADADGKF